MELRCQQDGKCYLGRDGGNAVTTGEAGTVCGVVLGQREGPAEVSGESRQPSTTGHPVCNVISISRLIKVIRYCSLDHD